MGNDETKAAGCAAFPRYLAACDRALVFVSPLYFSRLWCVYELATFARLHRDELEERMLLLSLGWSSWSGSVQMTEEETGWFTGFDLLKVQCAKPVDRAT